jgi:polyisoprenoid-binding protein YceI
MISSVDYSSATACKINGTLNIKGVGVPVSFDANIRSASEKGLFGQAYFSLDRTLLGIAYAGPSKDVQIAVHLFAK